MDYFRPEADVLELRRRYANMYIPSDFFSTNFRWVDAFPPHNPFTLEQPCSFHVMNKEVDAVLENLAVLEPPDADYLFSAKVRFISVTVLDPLSYMNIAVCSVSQCCMKCEHACTFSLCVL